MHGRRELCILMLSSLVVVSVYWLEGCGSHAPTLPSPGSGGGGGGEIIEVVDYVVAAREVVSFDHDTTVRASGRVQVDGAVIGADDSGPGQPGVSITIEAQQEIVVTGSISAGDGRDGTDGGDGGNGGNGGSLSLTSASGGITIGEPAEAEAVRPANGAGNGLHAGDGGNGGEGHLGGAGGAGGSVMLSCPNGTLTINQAPGLFHIGNGGHGGRGVVGGDDLSSVVVPQQIPSHGGNGGQLLVNAQNVQGLQFQDGGTTDDGTPVRVGMLDDGVADGGTGGEGGNFFYGVDPETGESTWPAQICEVMRAQGGPRKAKYTREAARGGDGFPVAGRGGDCSCHGQPGATNADYRDAAAVGGKGGNVTTNAATVWQSVRVLFGAEVRGGRGGDARAVGGRGGDGGACNDGGPGGYASASGGEGGHVLVKHWLCGINESPGRGGNAEAIGGAGGKGGTVVALAPRPGREVVGEMEVGHRLLAGLAASEMISHGGVVAMALPSAATAETAAMVFRMGRAARVGASGRKGAAGILQVERYGSAETTVVAGGPAPPAIPSSASDTGAQAPTTSNLLLSG